MNRVEHRIDIGGKTKNLLLLKTGSSQIKKFTEEQRRPR